MDSEQNYPGSFQRTPTLNGDLPEVLIISSVSTIFRQIQQGDVACSGEIHAGPQNVVASRSK